MKGNCKCENPECYGFVLLHPKEMSKLSEIKEIQRAYHPGCEFDLVDSPSSGEVFTKFKELHVLGGN